MKNNNTKSVEDLIVEVFEHPEMPEWILDSLWEVLNDHASINPYSPEQIRLFFKFQTKGAAGRHQK